MYSYMMLMRCYIFFALCFFTLGPLKAQDDRGGKKPKITGQNPVSTNEEQAVTIQLSDLTVRDQDDWFYPWGFSLRIYEGANYTFANNTVTPNVNFSGTLSVPVTVNDGESDSEKYDLQITVQGINDPPLITAQNGALVTEHNTAITIDLSHLLVTDPDDSYPSGFTLTLLSSNNNTYSVSGNQVIPSAGFSGMLSVSLQVNDGEANSNVFALSIEVKPGNKPPVITGQVPLAINEDEPLLLQLSNLTVSDPDNSYPSGFRLTVLPGNTYSASGNEVTPVKDFTGNLPVTVTVNDGTSESNAFVLQILVRPVNDAPVIIRIETEAIRYQIGNGAVLLTKEFEVNDPDNDSLVQAEIGIIAEQYRPGNDELGFTNTRPGIKGVFDRQRGLLTFTGKATVREYIEAIRSVTYNYITAGEPLKETKSVFFRVSDGKATSEARERGITTSEVVIRLDIPTAFTPNGDHANDTWRIQPLKQQDETMSVMVRIYNRFGKLLFETNGFEDEWDGRLNGELLPADTYYYTIDFTEALSKNSVKGIVALLR
jgi:gliding motility-associated-like protein